MQRKQPPCPRLLPLQSMLSICCVLSEKSDLGTRARSYSPAVIETLTPCNQCETTEALWLQLKCQAKFLALVNICSIVGYNQTCLDYGIDSKRYSA
jgi:hypothetical protein